MALEQRKMVSTQVKSLEHEMPELPKQKNKILRTRKYLSFGEKTLLVLFTTILVLFSSTILHTESQLNDMNREMQLLSNKVNDTKKQNTELSFQVRENSTYEKVWEKAKALGLNLNDKNVKVVPGR